MLFVALFAAAAGDDFTCGDCTVIQEAIQRSIANNISHFEEKSVGGSTATVTVEVGQIIWHLCKSDAWTSQRYQPALTKTCRRETRKHVDLMTNYWKEKTTEEYKDPAFALRMKRAVCPNQDVGACSLDTLPSDYEPLTPDECDVCRAITADIFGIVRFSRDRPTNAGSDAYFRLAGQMSSVCQDMPMRHAIRQEKRQAILEMCEDLWDEHEGAFSRMALHRDASYAAAICSDHAELCDEPTSREELYAHDPGAGGGDKDEL